MNPDTCTLCELFIVDARDGMQVTRDGGKAHKTCVRAYWKGHERGGEDSAPAPRMYLQTDFKHPMLRAIVAVELVHSPSHQQIELKFGDELIAWIRPIDYGVLRRLLERAERRDQGQLR